MIRSLLLYLSKARWAREIVTGWRFVWRIASRFVAGETLQDAILVARDLNSQGIFTTLDHLGEHTTSLDTAIRATEDVLEILEEIDKAGIQSGISIKLSQIGLGLDKQACAENLVRILTRASELNRFIRLDMEEYGLLEDTLELHRQMVKKGFRNTGVVIQSYLYRSRTDTARLLVDKTPVRIVKGAYQEPVDIAFEQKRDTDKSFDRIAEMLIDCTLENNPESYHPDGLFPPIAAIATHDEVRIANAIHYMAQLGLPKKCVEFQMLHGIRRDLQIKLIQEGYPVRVYVPYGTEWYPYFMRRLAEKPANLWFFLTNLIKR